MKRCEVYRKLLKHCFYGIIRVIAQEAIKPCQILIKEKTLGMIKTYKYCKQQTKPLGVKVIKYGFRKTNLFTDIITCQIIKSEAYLSLSLSVHSVNWTQGRLKMWWGFSHFGPNSKENCKTNKQEVKLSQELDYDSVSSFTALMGNNSQTKLLKKQKEMMCPSQFNESKRDFFFFFYHFLENRCNYPGLN